MRNTILLAALVVLAPVSIRAQERSAPGGRVNQLKVLSDKIDDVTTVENIVRSFAKPGMSEQERALALWTAVVKYRHQTAPPNEHLAGGKRNWCRAWPYSRRTHCELPTPSRRRAGEEKSVHIMRLRLRRARTPAAALEFAAATDTLYRFAATLGPVEQPSTTTWTPPSGRNTATTRRKTSCH